MDALTNPFWYPESLRYLHEWAVELYGTSGVSEAGLMPLSWQALVAWADLTGRRPTVDEIDGLRQLDAVMREPGDANG